MRGRGGARRVRGMDRRAIQGFGRRGGQRAAGGDPRGDLGRVLQEDGRRAEVTPALAVRQISEAAHVNLQR